MPLSDAAIRRVKATEKQQKLSETVLFFYLIFHAGDGIAHSLQLTLVGDLAADQVQVGRRSSRWARSWPAA
jgi:hypothetical protein